MLKQVQHDGFVIPALNQVQGSESIIYLVLYNS